jgi:hypothetical protein
MEGLRIQGFWWWTVCGWIWAVQRRHFVLRRVSQGAVSKGTEINKVQVRTAAGRKTLHDFITEALSQEGSVAR